MNAYARGDERAFRPLFQAYAPKLRAYFVWKGLRWQDADDLVQQTFLRVHRARESYREGEPVRAWFFAIARNQRLDHCRRQRRRPEQLCDLDAQPCAEPSCDNALRSERLRALAGALEQLPCEQRALINQRFMEERSWTEIATHAGTLPGTLRVRAHRVCTQLRGLLEPSIEEAA
ncbi:MAG TPA: RNA polymerase sigma factor [Polyangiales bacterium]|nr:RNA polymerase sigma factor [Polyangiales bacterium]